jgi:hypothetical protein
MLSSAVAAGKFLFFSLCRWRLEKSFKYFQSSAAAGASLSRIKSFVYRIKKNCDKV